MDYNLASCQDETKIYPVDSEVLKQKILDTELDFPKYICSFETTDFGVMYWDEENKVNPYLNHAILYPDKVSDLPGILARITQFYLEKEIQPRIRQPFTKGYFIDHADEFRKSGYDIQLFSPTRFMVLQDENKIRKSDKLEIKELNEWDERVAHDILIPDGNEQTVEQIRRNIVSDRYRVLVGFLENEAVTMATIFYGDHGVARLDSAETTAELRGQGHARELISTIVDMHRAESQLPLYLWPKNITAEKIFREAGFRDFFDEELAIAAHYAAIQ